jgi:hypothetical protein
MLSPEFAPEFGILPEFLRLLRKKPPAERAPGCAR